VKNKETERVVTPFAALQILKQNSVVIVTKFAQHERSANRAKDVCLSTVTD
jgi:hypothetical protein